MLHSEALTIILGSDSHVHFLQVNEVLLSYPPEVLNTYPYAPQRGGTVGKGQPTEGYVQPDITIPIFVGQETTFSSRRKREF